MLLVSTKQEIRTKNCTLLLYHIELWTNLIWNCFLNHSSAWRCSGITVWFAFDQERQHFAFSIPNNTFDVFHSAFPLPLCCGSSALHRMQQNVLDAESPLKMYRTFSMQKMFYRVQGTQDQTMLQRDYLCASGYSKRPLVDFSWCSVGRPTKTFQHFHRAAAWYDAAQRHCVWAFTQGHCYANHLRKRVLTYAIYAMLRKKKSNIRNNTRYPGGGVRTPPPE